MWVAEVSKNSIVLKMWFSTSVDITWYTEAVIYAKNLFLVRFGEWHRGSGTLKLTKCDKVEWGEKWQNARDILFWMAPCLICYFIVILLRATYEKFRHNLILRLYSVKHLVKHFTRPKQQATLRKLFSLPQPPYHQIKSC